MTTMFGSDGVKRIGVRVPATINSFFSYSSRKKSYGFTPIRNNKAKNKQTTRRIAYQGREL